jgi:hypothetical protein
MDEARASLVAIELPIDGERERSFGKIAKIDDPTAVRSRSLSPEGSHNGRFMNATSRLAFGSATEPEYHVVTCPKADS